MTKKVLFVDDNPNILSAVIRHLRKKYEIHIAQSGREALREIEAEGPFAVVVADWNMPDMKGPDLLSKAKSLYPNTVRVIFSGLSDQAAVITAINSGQIFRFILKPSSPIEMGRVIDESLEQHALLMTKERLLSETVGGTVNTLLEVLAVVAPRAYSKTRCLLSWTESMRDLTTDVNHTDLKLAVKMSQIGYMTLPPTVLYKLDQEKALTPEEERMLHKIPEVSFKLLEQIPHLEAVARAALYQQKTYDGEGLPEDGLKGDDLPKKARILKIFNDLWDVSKGGEVTADHFDLLFKKIENYDRIYFEICRLALLTGQARGKTALVTRSLSINQLEIGDILACDVREIAGRMILTKGHLLSAGQIDRLKNIAEITNITNPIKILRQMSTAAVDLNQVKEA